MAQTTLKPDNFTGGNAHTLTGLSTPDLIASLKQFGPGTGGSMPGITPGDQQRILVQLAQSGLTRKQAQALVNPPESTWQQIGGQITNLWPTLIGGATAWDAWAAKGDSVIAEGETATTGETTTGSGKGTAATAGGAGGTAVTFGKSLLNSSNKALGSLAIAALFTDIGLWKGLGMVIAGAVLVLIGIMNLAGVDPGGIAGTARKVI